MTSNERKYTRLHFGEFVFSAYGSFCKFETIYFNNKPDKNTFKKTFLKTHVSSKISFFKNIDIYRDMYHLYSLNFYVAEISMGFLNWHIDFKVYW